MNISDTVIKCTNNRILDNTYHKYCHNIYSQNGEDGIIEKLINELNIVDGTFCEFGASDGISSSNTYNLIKKYNFSGLAIEADINKYHKCLENYKDFKNITIEHGMVLYDDPEYNLDKWLKKANLPYNFDVLSIDIDCDDYYVWENMTEHNPKIVIFEVNSYRDPVFDELPRIPSLDYNIDLLKSKFPNRVAQGCSFISAIKLGLSKNYIPLSFTGNLIFIRKDLTNNLKEFPYKISDNCYDYIYLYTYLVLWKNEWYTNYGLLVNVAIGDYFILTGKKEINIEWIKNKVNEILKTIV
jgi:hypothetical protein